MLALASAGFIATTGRAVVVQRPLESMVRLPAGRFKMGASDEAQRAALRLCREEIGDAVADRCRPELFVVEGPELSVYLSELFIDRVEVTVAAYRECVLAGICSPAPLLAPDQRFLAPTQPVTSVTWDEARRYCAWRGARLPTEAEWERAARGRDGRTFPWGNIARGDAANHGRFQTIGEGTAMPVMQFEPDASDRFVFSAPVGAYPEGASPEGALDLAGNVMEWTADVYAEEPPQRRSTVNPRGPAVGATRVVRGGSWREPLIYHRTTARSDLTPDTRSPEVGFRCAR
jgi:formylglycine-generating enzyme required for sulfatase activity